MLKVILALKNRKWLWKDTHTMKTDGIKHLQVDHCKGQGQCFTVAVFFFSCESFKALRFICIKCMYDYMYKMCF